MVRAENLKTKVVSEFTNEQWADMQKDTNWSGKFRKLDEPKKAPAEVKNLADKKDNTKK